MLVFFKRRLVFLAMPKTGSTSYEQALSEHADLVLSNPPALKHAPLYRYNRFIRPMYRQVCQADLEVMAVIRNPIDWLGSWYRYRQRPHMRDHPNSTANMSFDTFVSAYCRADRPGFANVGDQSKFLAEQKNGTRVHHLFAYEDTARLDGFLEERIGAVPTIPRLNVSPKGDLTLAPETEARFRRKHARTFELHASALHGL